MIKTSLSRLAIAAPLLVCGLNTPVSQAERPNVLFIAIDDMRPETRAYGNEMIHSPNLDRLAAEGMLFNRAYCQAALCMPSRASLLSGRRPGVRGINATDSQDMGLLKEVMDESLTLPQLLRENGYATLNVGKIFHTYGTDDKDAWTKQLKWGGGGYQTEFNLDRERVWREKIKEEGKAAKWRYPRGNAAEASDVSDNKHPDFRIATKGIQLMREHKDEPFFLAVGFFKPHLPFVAPQKYWDLYDRDAIPVPSYDEPTGVAPYSLVESWYEMRPYGDIPGKGNLNDEKTRELIHGYYACISFIDAQVGRLLDELEAQGLAENTIVIVWGDHGFKLGEYGDWSKYTNMEIDTRVPLIIKGPGVEVASSDALVELIDLYPTVAELCQVEIPEHVEATSMVPLLADSSQAWKAGALSYFDRRNPDGEGFSIRGDRFRYTEWRDYETGEVLARELYDHTDGPVATENLVDHPDYADDVDRLASTLKGGWQAIMPSGIQH